MSALADYLNAVGPVFGKMLLLPVTVGVIAIAANPRARSVIYNGVCYAIFGLYCFLAWLADIRVDEE